MNKSSYKLTEIGQKFGLVTARMKGWKAERSEEENIIEKEGIDKERDKEIVPGMELFEHSNDSNHKGTSVKGSLIFLVDKEG